jgi:hypothetical protein
MTDSLADLHARVVAALRDADALRLYDVGIALDTARLHLEHRIIEVQTGLTSDREVAPDAVAPGAS